MGVDRWGEERGDIGAGRCGVEGGGQWVLVEGISWGEGGGGGRVGARGGGRWGWRLCEGWGRGGRGEERSVGGGG